MENLQHKVIILQKDWLTHNVIRLKLERPRFRISISFILCRCARFKLVIALIQYKKLIGCQSNFFLE